MTEDIYREFMRQTQVAYMPASPQSQGAPQPPLELPLPPDARRIALPKPDEIHIPPADLRTVIEKRRTLRKYAEGPLTLDELSFLLWCSQGVQSVTSRPATLRPVPSAGARHAFETYLLVNRVESLKPGLYRFGAIEHLLVELNLAANIAEDITRGCHGQKMVLNSAATFIWAAVTERMFWRYPGRGYRYLHLDAGHVCQNLYLAAEATGCGACAIADFLDDDINKILGLDGEKMFVIYIASVGKRGG